jgi:hypothetical protein
MAGERDGGSETGGNDAGRNDVVGGIHGLSIRNLDDFVATAIVFIYLSFVLFVMMGWLRWSDLPDSLQYWTTSAFVIALGLIFGKGVNEYRRGVGRGSGGPG